MANEYQITIVAEEQPIDVTIVEETIEVQMENSGPPGPTGPSSRRVTTLADGPIITPDVDVADIFLVTLGGDRTIADPEGTPVDGNTMIEFRFTQGAGGGHQPIWGAKYHFSVDQPEPVLSLLAGKSDYVGFAYNAVTGLYDCLAVSRGH